MLTDQDATLLSLHAQPWKHDGAREQAVFEATGLSQWPAWQRLNELLDTREAVEAFPVAVNRLRRLRAARLR